MPSYYKLQRLYMTAVARRNVAANLPWVLYSLNYIDHSSVKHSCTTAALRSYTLNFVNYDYRQDWQHLAVEYRHEGHSYVGVLMHK